MRKDSKRELNNRDEMGNGCMLRHVRNKTPRTIGYRELKERKKGDIRSGRANKLEKYDQIAKGGM